MHLFKKILFFAVFAVILSAQAHAFPQAGTNESQIRIDSMVSKTLHVIREYSVYLPESYMKAPDKKYPVLYLLHGHSHSNNDWVTDGKIQEVADLLKGENKTCEMIIIMPDAGSIRNGYFDTKGWNYETFFFEEFIPFVEKKYRIIGKKSDRAIAGFSMGGGGAAAYALEYPDMFSSVYAMSALMTLPKRDRTALSTQDSTPVADPQMVEFGKSVLANDCIVRVSFSDDTSLEKYRTIRWFLDCGDDDFLLDVNFRFYQEMQRAKVPCELRVRDGNHNWEYWRSALYMALPFVSDGFGK